MNLLHHVDAVRGLLGVECDWVFADTISSEIAGEVEDTASLLAHFGTTTATFVGGASVIDGPGESICLWGNAGRAMILPQLKVTSKYDWPGSGNPDNSWDPRVRAIERFASVVAHGGPSQSGMANALAAQAIVAAAYESAATCRPVAPATILSGGIS